MQTWLQQSCAEQVGAFRIEHHLALSSRWTTVFGPSGSGKSTWLRMLAGLLPQQTGSLLICGAEMRSVPPHRRRVALVEQSPSLFPHLNVWQNVAFAASKQYRDLVDPLLESFQLQALRRAPIRTLSGGERQRVAIARALCARPVALLLDEVFTGLDASLAERLFQVVRQWQERLELPIVSVTHDVAEVFSTASEVLRMREGNIIAQGSAQEVLRLERLALLRRLDDGRFTATER